MTIHATDPFATPEPDRSPLRRVRGRLPAAVTLWTAYGPDGRPAGLTVSSTVVVEGDPGHVVGLLDEESDLWTAIVRGGVFAVMPLREEDGRLADAFAGLAPAPGGPFAGHPFTATPFGPVLVGVAAVIGCRLRDSRPLGWSRLVEATVESVELADPTRPLVHYRGRYGAVGELG